VTIDCIAEMIKF